MSRYKVEHITTEEVRSKWYDIEKTFVDTWSLAKELEALIIEYENKNYKVLTIESVVTPVAYGQGTGSKTEGLIVVFEKVTP